VDITSDEERWALRWAIYYALARALGADYAFARLVNMLASLNCMMLEGFTVSNDGVIVGRASPASKKSVKCLFLESYTARLSLAS
jgi:hypothetical protein